jgi:hypothetical protein
MVKKNYLNEFPPKSIHCVLLLPHIAIVIHFTIFLYKIYTFTSRQTDIQLDFHTIFSLIRTC